MPNTPREASMFVLKRLRAKGFKALFAGGCVRDELLGFEPKDYDVATDARPEDVLACFPWAKAVGQQFGVMLVRRHGVDVEVATFRAEGAYSDGRRPDEVTFTDEVEDATRRDFTVNGMFFDPIERRVIDTVGGRADLEKRLIRTIGSPDHRFAEDHLRMLRAVRFATLLDFDIDPDTFQAVQRLAPKLRLISSERVWMELEKILSSDRRSRGWNLLRRTGLILHVARDWTWTEDETERIERRLAGLPEGAPDETLPLAALLCDRSAREVEAFCLSLRLSNRQLHRAAWLVGALPQARHASRLELADVKGFAAHGAGDDLLHLLKADLQAKGEEETEYQCLKERMQAIDPADARPAPLLTGQDLLDAGYSPGPAFGKVLHAIHRAQLNEEIDSKAQALEKAKRLMESR